MFIAVTHCRLTNKQATIKNWNFVALSCSWVSPFTLEKNVIYRTVRRWGVGSGAVFTVRQEIITINGEGKTWIGGRAGERLVLFEIVTSIDTVTVDWHQNPGCFYVSRKLVIKKWWGWKAGKEEDGGGDEESLWNGHPKNNERFGKKKKGDEGGRLRLFDIVTSWIAEPLVTVHAAWFLREITINK